MAIANPRKHLTDIDEWRRLGEAGIFPPASRLELINGEILEMSPIGCNHAGHLNRILNRLLNIVSGDVAIASVQNPLQLGDLSEPEPDFMLLKPNPDFYSTRHPVAADVLLLIEVADSSLEFDRNQKMHLYALHRIPEYWLLNLNEASVEVYRKPAGDLYAEKRTLVSGDSIALSELPEITIDIGDII
ncbi:MAG: Uma2 family endonuclease [Methylomicrobium sp.]|nr:Uma2 family endonuclease [Methylomicrobium sp.]